MRFGLKRGPERLVVEIGGRETAVQVIRNPRARRLILRIDAATGSPALTLPPRSSLAQGEAFLHGNIGWLERRLRRASGGVPFCDGAIFPLRGDPCRIVHRGGRGLVSLEWREDGLVLSIPGEAEHLERRVGDWLKREARRAFTVAVARCAGALGKRPTSIRIGDAGSRWGSCSAKGALAFSWRLILAPPHVLDYLAAHEVAHLAEMNHGPRFWALVRRLEPEFETARAWLKRHGAGLHAVGRCSPAGK
jgi:predicted metal-dependent hydrolase